MRFTLVVLVVMAGLGLAPASASASSSAPSSASAPAAPAACDLGVHRAPGIAVCEHATGSSGMEPMLVHDSRGTLFMGLATSEGVFDQLPEMIVGKADSALLRSRDDGRHWTRIALPEGVNASEGIPYVDPVTDRLFVTSFELSTGCGQPVVWSDDEGASWHAAAQRPGCVPLSKGDWPKLFTGPFKGRAPGAYPQAVYECNFVPDILVAAAIGCWRSDDGGAHFRFTSFLPVHNVACGAGRVRGQAPVTIVHGTGQVLPDGDVVVPVTVCGSNVVVRSQDMGRTWRIVDTGLTGGGLAGFARGHDGLPQSVFQQMFFDQTLAQDDRGNLFLAASDRGVHLAVSRDGGRTWRRLGTVSPASVRGTVLPSITARGDGEVALAWLGTGDGERLLDAGERYLGWMAYAPDALAAHPRFSAAPTSTTATPMETNGLLGCCATPKMFTEYTGVTFTGKGQVRAAFARFGDADLPRLTLGMLALTR